MRIKEAIKTLLESKEVSNYKISKETGIAQTTLSDYVSGKSDIENMKLRHATVLYDYYLRSPLSGSKNNTIYDIINEVSNGESVDFEVSEKVKLKVVEEISGTEEWKDMRNRIANMMYEFSEK